MNAVLHPDILGQIARTRDGFAISVQSKDHERRKRFTAAHELGHYLFHRDLLEEGTDDDKAYRSTKRGNFYNQNIKKWHETEANRFAANLLMPPPSCGEVPRDTFG
jgi:Zn-dependent peptidase ImmA (M78 family)